MITQKLLEQILDNFAKQEMIFSNEQDFQFELALELARHKELVADVKLEPLSIDISWSEVLNLSKKGKSLTRKTKQYTDILLQDVDGNFVAIELKYKTPNKICCYTTQNNNHFVTMSQGAYDFGVYDFLKDVERLEHINERHFAKDIKITQAFAIMLTNDKNYRFNDFSRSKIWMNYGIFENAVLPKGTLTFCGQTQYKTKHRTFDAITLKNTYVCNWRNYPLKNYHNYYSKQNPSPGFSYLVLPICCEKQKN